jgi:hypothetical protein
MAGGQRIEVPGELSSLAGKLDRWRRSRSRGSRIPESFWASAVELAGRWGLSRTATALRVGYYCLQERCERASRSEPSAAATFVEVPPGSFVGPATECVIEWEKASGARLRIRLPGAPDLAALSRSFWETA